MEYREEMDLCIEWATELQPRKNSETRKQNTQNEENTGAVTRITSRRSCTDVDLLIKSVLSSQTVSSNVLQNRRLESCCDFLSKRVTKNHQAIKLGGCADPDIFVRSIIDPMYIPNDASNTGRIHSKPYGFLHDDSINNQRQKEKIQWDVGAVAECGIPDTNEDSYLILNDVLAAFGPEESIPENITNGNWNHQYSSPCQINTSNQGIFAIFDGHCGNQAARYAAERFPAIFLEESQNFSTKSIPIQEEIESLLVQCISRLDYEFCQLCTTDGREWISGATAIIALIIDNIVAVAGLGDSNGVFCLSIPHGSHNQEHHISGDDNRTSDCDWSLLEPDGHGGYWKQPHQEQNGRYETKKLPNPGKNSHNDILWTEVAVSHKPSRDDELERIKAANGWITTEKVIPMMTQIERMDFFDEDIIEIVKNCFSDRLDDAKKVTKSCSQSKSKRYSSRVLHISRVCGELSVSRALGDREFKAAFNIASSTEDKSLESRNAYTSGNRNVVSNSAVTQWKSPTLFLPYPDNHNHQFQGDLISSRPEIRFFQLGPHGNDQFLLLACDGLWDVIDAEDAVRITVNLLYVKRWSAKMVAIHLAELAKQLGSSDNITVLLIRFL